MTAVRKIVTILSGTLARERYYGTNCGEGLCICPDHVVQRTQAEHARAMAHRANTGAIKSLRMVKMTATRRRTHAKLTPELAGEIRNSEDSGPVLAQRYGITRSLVNRIKRGVQWKDATNPFSGLGGR